MTMDFFDWSDQLCANCCQPCPSRILDPGIGGSENALFGSVDGLHRHIVIEKMSNVNSTILIDWEEEKEDRRMTINVSDALSKIYNLSHLNIFNDGDKNTGVCDACARALSKLYEGFDELGQLRHQSSYLAQNILKLDQILQKLQSTLQNKSTAEVVIESGACERATAKLKVEIEDQVIYDDQPHSFNDDEHCDGGGSPLFPEDEEPSEGTEMDQNFMDKMKLPVQPLTSSSSSMRREGGGLPWIRLKRLTSTELAAATSSKADKKRSRAGPKSKPKLGSEIKKRKRQSKIKINVDEKHASLLVTMDDDDDDCDDPNFIIEKNDEVDDEDFNPLASSAATKKKKSKKSSSKSPKKIVEAEEKPKKKRGRKRKPVVEKKRKLLPKLPSWSVWKSMIKVETEADEARVRNKEPPFECKLCGKVFNSLTGMKLHAMTEMGEKPYKCPIPGCPQSFVVGAFLTAHMFTHTGGDFECEICHKKFSSPHSLVPHMRAVHDKLKRFLCTVCGKSFYTQSYLRRHEICHADLRPFNCDTCGTVFKYRQSLIRHRMTIHGDKGFLCTICGRAFGRPDHLKSHMTRQHKDHPLE